MCRVIALRQCLGFIRQFLHIQMHMSRMYLSVTTYKSLITVYVNRQYGVAGRKVPQNKFNVLKFQMFC